MFRVFYGMGRVSRGGMPVAMRENVFKLLSYGGRGHEETNFGLAGSGLRTRGTRIRHAIGVRKFKWASLEQRLARSRIQVSPPKVAPSQTPPGPQVGKREARTQSKIVTQGELVSKAS